MDDWEKFSETSLTGKEDLYSYLNMRDITDVDCWCRLKIWNKKFRRISWFVCSKQYGIVSWFIREP